MNDKQKTTIFRGPYNSVGSEIVGQICCYQQFEFSFEFKIDKLVLKERGLVSAVENVFHIFFKNPIFGAFTQNYHVFLHDARYTVLKYGNRS